MEILSTGEKIKRARIYAGITLKELCEEKISVSKMSCIENGKIKAEKDILEYICEKLELNYDYLVKDVRDQIEENLNKILNGKVKKSEIYEFITYNLNYATKHSHYDLGFKLIHKLFRLYLESENFNEANNLLLEYSGIFEKECTKENKLIYYKDMGEFFAKNEEFTESLNYYEKLINELNLTDENDLNNFAYASYCKTICKLMVLNVDDAYNIMKNCIEKCSNIKDKKMLGKIYGVYGSINIALKNPESEKYLKLAEKYQKNNKIELGKTKAQMARAYFIIEKNDKAKETIKNGLEIFRSEDKERLIKYLIYSIEMLYKNNEYEFMATLLEEALNLAIDFDEVTLIERAYYFKSKVLQKQNQYMQAEIYMNLSTDNLLKFASNQQLFKRYNEMGQLYYNLKELKESIKYFTLAMSLEKVI